MKIKLVTKQIHRMIRDLHLDKTSGASELIKTALEIIKAQLDVIKDPQMDIKDVMLELFQELLKEARK